MKHYANTEKVIQQNIENVKDFIHETYPISVKILRYNSIEEVYECCYTESYELHESDTREQEMISCKTLNGIKNYFKEEYPTNKKLMESLA